MGGAGGSDDRPYSLRCIEQRGAPDPVAHFAASLAELEEASGTVEAWPSTVGSHLYSVGNTAAPKVVDAPPFGPAVSFATGEVSALVGESVEPLFHDDFTLLVALEPTDAPAVYASILRAGGLSDHYVTLQMNGVNFQFGRHVGTLDNVLVPWGGGPAIVTARRTGSLYELFNGNVPGVPDNFTEPSPSNGTSLIGGDPDSVEPWQGHIAEILIFDVALENRDRIAVLQCVEEGYGL